ncbi:hypothetical protein AURDEDRAFT_172537 [Auricularia subglabra TFB-10046 SS5]|nr:hypothetical protein AURDEDRAFT_172537 [Auricularia subglabra TFB-10046 SS5]
MNYRKSGEHSGDAPTFTSTKESNRRFRCPPGHSNRHRKGCKKHKHKGQPKGAAESATTGGPDLSHDGLAILSVVSSSSTITIIETPTGLPLQPSISSVALAFRAEFIAGIISLALSPVALTLIALYYLRRRRARLRQKRSKADAEAAQDSASIHAYDVATEPPAGNAGDSKHVLESEKPPDTRVLTEDARRSPEPSSLDDPEKRAELRRVMQQAGVTFDAMVIGLSRVAQIPSYRSTGPMERPLHSPPGYER